MALKLNPKEILFGTDSGKKDPVLPAVTPPRVGERTLLGVENLLQSIAVPEPFSLELVGDMDGVTLMARCLDDRVVRGQISAHYPQARIQKVDPDNDPLRLDEGEQAWSITLRSGARALSPSAKGVRGGALVGDTTARAKREIRFPEDLLRRHHLYVAHTRMGKSTLMHHLVTHKLREKAEGRDPDAIVVIDPHTDLVAGILEHVPESLIDRVRLIDLSDETRSPGINLLDTRIFSNRDRTADSVVRVAKGLWDQWGPRMQSILEQTVKTLHEANEQMEEGEQYTILDGLKLLSEEKFRKDVLKMVSDPYLLEWWARDYGRWNPQYRAEALAPVQTRLSYYASSKRARAILGQRRSTIDLRRTVLEGGVLLVSTSQGTVGRDVAALVGASLLNLVDAVIREQGSLPLHRRRGALVVVDEMQSMPGVDYESMLSELGKFGASFVLATQSLAKLDDLSPTTRDTLLANVGCLAVFQVAGNGARTLVWELGKDRVTEDDITSLPVHHCYVRATVGTEGCLHSR